MDSMQLVPYFHQTKKRCQMQTVWSKGYHRACHWQMFKTWPGKRMPKKKAISLGQHLKPSSQQGYQCDQFSSKLPGNNRRRSQDRGRWGKKTESCKHQHSLVYLFCNLELKDTFHVWTSSLLTKLASEIQSEPNIMDKYWFLDKKFCQRWKETQNLLSSPNSGYLYHLCATAITQKSIQMTKLYTPPPLILYIQQSIQRIAPGLESWNCTA